MGFTLSMQSQKDFSLAHVCRSAVNMISNLYPVIGRFAKAVLPGNCSSTNYSLIDKLQCQNSTRENFIIHFWLLNVSNLHGICEGHFVSVCTHILFSWSQEVCRSYPCLLQFDSKLCLTLHSTYSHSKVCFKSLPYSLSTFVFPLAVG